MTTTLQPSDLRSDLKPIWCPGCGDFGVLTAIYRALAAVGRPPHEIAFVSGIGCSSRIPGYTTATSSLRTRRVAGVSIHGITRGNIRESSVSAKPLVSALPDFIPGGGMIGR